MTEVGSGWPGRELLLRGACIPVGPHKGYTMNKNHPRGLLLASVSKET